LNSNPKNLFPFSKEQATTKRIQLKPTSKNKPKDHTRLINQFLDSTKNQTLWGEEGERENHTKAYSKGGENFLRFYKIWTVNFLRVIRKQGVRVTGLSSMVTGLSGILPRAKLF
jgi:hypothetical protein